MAACSAPAKHRLRGFIPVIANWSPSPGRGPCSGEPFIDVESEIAEDQKHPGPYKCRYDIGDLKMPIIHFQNAGDQRHRSPQGPEEAANKNSQNSPALHEGMA